MWTQPFLNSVALLVIGAIVTFLATMYWKRRGDKEKLAEKLEEEVEKRAKQLKEENEELKARVQATETQLKLLSQAVLPISAAFQAILIKELTHFHTPELDLLMEKIGPPNTMTPAEEARMVVLLRERSEEMNGSIPEQERDAAAMLPMVIKRVKLDAESEKKLQLVSIPKTPKDGVLDETPLDEPVKEKKAEEG